MDGTSRAASGSVTVGPWTTAGTKTLLIECWNNGKAGYAANTLSVTVYNVAKPVITTTLSKSLLEAGKDKFVVTYSATNAKSCMLGGTKYPTSGSATLGPYSAGKHSLTFSCSGDGGETSHTINWEAINRVSISASVSPSTVKANGSDTVRVSWTGSNADSCKLDGANASTSGSKTFGPYSYSQAGTKSATVSCANRLGSSSNSVSWKADAPKPAVSATLSEYTVTAGVDRVNLSWTSSNADSCSYDGRTRAVNGTIRNLGPFTAGTHNFTVSCTGAGGTTSDTATLTAEKAPDPPTVTVRLNPDTITADTGTSTLSWSSTDATSCTRNSRTVATKGTATVGPYSQGSYEFTVSCAGPGGNASDTATLTVEPQPDPPTVTLRLNPATIEAGSDTSTLTWSSRNATSCSRDGTAVATGGSAEVGPYATAGTRRFTVSCDGPGGSDSETRSLTVEQPDPPSVTVSLSKTTITADKDTVTLTWSSTDAASCKYGSTNLSVSGTRTIGPFSAGTHNVAVNCTGVGGTGSASASLSAVATPSQPDNDRDGIADKDDPDDDNDGMTDAWEIENGFNSLSATDATLDADNDGQNNLAEFNGGSDPHWTLSTPGNLPEILPGFNAGYTAQKGDFNNDTLQDILIRNPVPGVVPAVSDFVLIRKASGGFSLEDAADHTIPSASNLASIESAIRLYDLNADGVTDLLLKGLDTHIQDAADQIVFSGHDRIYEIPEDHVAVGATFEKFFSDLAKWIRNPSYLEGPLSTGRKLPVVKRDENENEEEFLMGASGSVTYAVYGAVSLSIDLWNQNIGNCIGYSSVFCLLMGDNGYWLGPQSILYGGYLLTARDPYEVVISIPSVGSEPPPDLNVYNTSGFDSDARFLALNVLRQYRDSRTLDPGSRFARIVSDTLEAILDVEVFGGALEDEERGVLATVGDYCISNGVECDIVEALEFILERIRQTLIQCTSSDADDCEAVPATIPDITPTNPDDDSEPVVDITKVGTDDLVISTAPAMPAATFNAEVKGLSGSGYEIAYDWNAYLYYRGTGRERVTYVYQADVETEDENGNKVTKKERREAKAWQDEHHDFIDRIPTVGTASGLAGPSVLSNNWTIPWGAILQGGSLTVQVSATVSSGGTAIATVSNQQTFPIAGSNPSLAQMKEIIGDSNEKLAVAWAESTHRQFVGARYTGTGEPVYGEPDGWGIMQIDNIPKLTRTVEHFWNWRVNLKAGSDYLNTLYDEALEYFKFHYVPPMEGDPDSGWSWNPANSGTDVTVKAIIWNDAFSRYNTGRPMYSPDGNDGKEHCEYEKDDEIIEDGKLIDPYMNPVGCGYANKIRVLMDEKPWNMKSQ